jgi:hypothetical protein
MIVVSQGHCRIVIVVRWFNSSKMGSGAGELNGCQNRSSIDRHTDGSIEARGYTINDVLTGYWGVVQKRRHKMRSGCFENGKQTSEWTTYDAKG